MTKFYICRHGETDNNRAKKLQGWIDTPLTPKGRQDSLASAEKLRGINIDKIVSSDLGRAFHSAYIISRIIGYSDEIIRSSELREINYGELANTPYDKFPNIEPGTEATHLFPGGESLAQMQGRVLGEVKQLSQIYAGQVVLIVAHDGTISSIRAKHLGQDIAEADLISNPYDFVAVFESNDREITSFQEI